MTGHFESLRRAFAALLQELSAAWPEKDIDYVNEEVRYNEFGIALESLIALGLQNGCGFSSDQLQKIEAMAAAMEMEDSPFLVRLRQMHQK